eukprot:13685528-Heterocapsa_arctica.AAC.1
MEARAAALGRPAYDWLPGRLADCLVGRARAARRPPSRPSRAPLGQLAAGKMPGCAPCRRRTLAASTAGCTTASRL